MKNKTYFVFSKAVDQPDTFKVADFENNEAAIAAGQADPDCTKIQAADGSDVIYRKEEAK